MDALLPLATGGTRPTERRMLLDAARHRHGAHAAGQSWFAKAWAGG